MNRKIVTNVAVLMALLAIISLLGGWVRYMVQKPYIFVETLNKNRFVENSVPPEVISQKKAYEWFVKDSVLFVDTRPMREMEISTIPTAVHWDETELKEMIALCRKNKGRKIIFFCSEGCDHSRRAAETMSRILSYRFYIMFEGFEKWEDAGFPVLEGYGL